MISIIIPFYNNEKTLNRCLMSIKDLTYKDFECILVNNNSTDNSLDVCQIFLNDKRFRIIDCKDQGVHHSRNKGLQETKGDWIMFIDADDHIVKLYLQHMIDTKNKHPGYKAYTSSCITINLLRSNNIDRWNDIEEGEYTKDDIELYNRNTIWSVVWACLWSKDVFDHLKFQTFIGEDTLVCIEFLVRYGKLYHTKYYGYAHIINENSISQLKENYIDTPREVIECLRNISNIRSLNKDIIIKLNEYYFSWTNIIPFNIDGDEEKIDKLI